MSVSVAGGALATEGSDDGDAQRLRVAKGLRPSGFPPFIRPCIITPAPPERTP